MTPTSIATYRGVILAGLRLVTTITLVLVTVTVAGAIVLLMILPRATQGSALTVLTGSMTPKIPVGSIVMVRPVDPSTLEVGDLATYQKKPGVESYVTHRIVNIDTSTTPANFIFKGDANRGADVNPVPSTAIRGEVWFHVPYLGAVRDALNGKAGLSLLAMLVLGGYAVSQVWGAMQDRRRSNAAGTKAAASLPATISCDRPLILVEFPTDEAGGGATVAHALDGMLLTESAETFMVVLAPSLENVDAMLDDLQMLGPTSVRVIAGGGSPLVLASKAPVRPQSDEATWGQHVPV